MLFKEFKGSRRLNDALRINYQSWSFSLRDVTEEVFDHLFQNIHREGIIKENDVVVRVLSIIDCILQADFNGRPTLAGARTKGLRVCSCLDTKLGHKFNSPNAAESVVCRNQAGASETTPQINEPKFFAWFKRIDYPFEGPSINRPVAVTSFYLVLLQRSACQSDITACVDTIESVKGPNIKILNN